MKATLRFYNSKSHAWPYEVNIIERAVELKANVYAKLIKADLSNGEALANIDFDIGYFGSCRNDIEYKDEDEANEIRQLKRASFRAEAELEQNWIFVMKDPIVRACWYNTAKPELGVIEYQEVCEEDSGCKFAPPGWNLI